jgi:hypothetical protein
MFRGDRRSWCVYRRKDREYDPPRRAMPTLLQNVESQKTGSSYGDEPIEIFRGFGEVRDKEETTETLKA